MTQEIDPDGLFAQETASMRLPPRQLQDTQNDFSRPLKRTSSGAARTVGDHGEPVGVIASEAGYEKRIRPTGGRLSELMLKSGLAGAAFGIVRENDPGRDLKL